jgi:uncharacterized coiled-coil DUF342 family protein
VLPQDERWTPAKKRRQMQQLMRQMREARGSHNAQVLALRQRKRELVGRLNSMRTRMAVLDEQLGVTGGSEPEGLSHCDLIMCSWCPSLQ